MFILSRVKSPFASKTLSHGLVMDECEYLLNKECLVEDSNPTLLFRWDRLRCCALLDAVCDLWHGTFKSSSLDYFSWLHLIYICQIMLVMKPDVLVWKTCHPITHCVDLNVWYGGFVRWIIVVYRSSNMYYVYWIYCKLW